jgi:hypothetical protein
MFIVLINIVNFIPNPLKTLFFVHLNNEIPIQSFEICVKLLNVLLRQGINVHVISYVFEYIEPEGEFRRSLVHVDNGDVVFNHVSVTDNGVSTGINVVKHVYT